MATSTNLIRTLTIRSKTEGVQDSTSQLRGLAAAQGEVTTASASTEKATLSVERAFQRLQRQLDASVKSQEQMAKAAQTLERAQAQGLVTQERANELMAAAATQYNKTASAISDMTKRMSESTMANTNLVRGMSQAGTAAKAANDNLAGAASGTEKFTAANGLARFELINLSRQIQDVGVSLASGQSIMTVAIQQGAQIGDIFASSGVSAAGFGKQILGMISPMVLLVGGVTAAVAALTLMATTWSKVAIEALNLSRRLDAPIDKIQELQSAAAVKGISGDDFGKAMGAFADQVALAQRGLGDLKELFRLNGQTIEKDVVANLMKVADLVRGAATETDKLNVLQAAGLPRTQEFVRLAEQGGEAWRKLGEEMGNARIDPEMAKAAERFTEAWRAAWESFKISALAAMGDVLSGLSGLVTSAGNLIKGVLGSARTRGDELDAEAAAAGGPLKLTVRPAKPTVTPEDLKAMEQEISLQKQRISLLGDLATSQEKAEVARKEIDVARLKGVEISKGEGDAIVKNIELDLKHSAKIKELKEDYKQVEHAIEAFGNTLINSMLDGATATEALGKALEGLGKQLINIGMHDFAQQISKSVSGGLESLIGGATGTIGGPLASVGVGVAASIGAKLFGGGDAEPKAKDEKPKPANDNEAERDGNQRRANAA